jgi:hypothetical protein
LKHKADSILQGNPRSTVDRFRVSRELEAQIFSAPGTAAAILAFRIASAAIEKRRETIFMFVTWFCETKRLKRWRDG